MGLYLPRRRVWRAAIYLGSLLLVLIAIDMLLVQSRRTIHPGFDTTRVVAPVLPDGSIDYLLACDAHFGAGVTPQNNAAVLALQAFGRSALSPKQPRDGVTERLGMAPLSEQGDYFIPYDEYLKQHSVSPGENWSEATNPRPWPVTYDAITTQWIKDSEKPLALLAEASKRTRFFIPFYAGFRHETMIELPLPYVIRMRDACRALRARALMRLSSDDVQGFREDMMTVHRLARLVGQEATMIEKLVAIITETAACENERVGISSGKIPPDQARAMAKELADLGDLPSLVDSLDKGERYFSLEALQYLAKQSPAQAGRSLVAWTTVSEPPRLAPAPLFNLLPIPYEACMRSINHYNDGAIAAMRERTYPQRHAAIEVWKRDVSELDLKDFSTRDLLQPDWPIRIFMSPWMKSMQREETARVENRLTQVAFALAAFKAERGSYPATLDELAPNYLQTVPNDLFSDKPLVYSRNGTGYTLYSVGPNMNDDGGDKKTGDDIVASSR